MRSGVATRFTASGVVSAVPTVVNNITVGHADAAQTAKLHNCAAVVDATNGNCKFTIPLDTPQAWPLEEVRFDVGCVVVLSGGTPDVTVSTV